MSESPRGGTTHRVLSVVVNWRLPEATTQCVRSLTRSTLASDIVIMDNESDGSLASRLAADGIHASVLSSPLNLGFAGGCNRAITSALEAAHEYVFLLNNDATVAEDALEWLVRRADEDPQTGILGAKVYYRDHPNTIWFAGARRRQGVLAATASGRNQLDRGQFDDRQIIDYVFGAAMLVRRSMLDAIGLFDDRFFLYLEDLDLSLRARAAGYQLRFVPEARAWHTGSASTSNEVARRRYHMARSTVLFLRKHTSLVNSLPVMSFWVAVYLRDILRDLWRGESGTIRACVAGLRSGASSHHEAGKGSRPFDSGSSL